MIKTINIIGCGAMGSHIATSIIRDFSWGGRLVLIDFDNYEPKNLANQAIARSAISKPKVHGLKHELLRINNKALINCINRKVDGNKYIKEALSGLVVVCVDSMQVRYEIMHHLLQANRRVQYVVETRADAGAGVSHAFNPNNKNQCDCWWLYWHSDNAAWDRLGCNQSSPIHSAILHTTALASSQIRALLYEESGNFSIAENRLWMDFDLRQQGFENWPLDKPR